MARFQQTAPYAGKGQKDLASRVESLRQLGIEITEKNEFHPHLYSRRAVVDAERRLSVVWRSWRHVPIDPPPTSTFDRAMERDARRRQGEIV